MGFLTSSSSLLLPLLAATTLVPSATDAFFILSHSKSLVHTRIDPIVNPGGVSGHMHNVVGANSFNRTYDHTLQREATCTTSPIQNDLSSYWASQIYYQAENGSLTIVPTAFVNTYYLNRNGPKGQAIKAFPPGLRMLAGDLQRTTFNSSLFSNTAISFVCLDYIGVHTDDPAWDQRNSFFKHDCPDGQRMQVNFPSCWNGVDLDSIDHMSYPIQNVDGGDCPDTHPVQLVSLFYEFDQPLPLPRRSFRPRYRRHHRLRLPYAYAPEHADFADGWDTAVLQSAIDTCPDQTSGNIDICPALAASINKSKQEACQPVNDIVDEDVGLGTWISSLPGNNLVKDSRGQAMNSASKADYTEAATFVPPAGDLPGGWKAEGCFAEGTGARALQGFSVVNKAMTIDICLNACKAQGFSYAGVEFGNECYCDSSLRAGSTNVVTPAPVCAVVCPGNQYVNCGGASTLSIFSYDTNYVATTTSPSVAATTSTSTAVDSSSSSDSTSGSGFAIETPSSSDATNNETNFPAATTTSPIAPGTNEDVVVVQRPTSPADEMAITTPTSAAGGSPPQPSSSSAKAKARRLRAQARRSRMHHRRS